MAANQPKEPVGVNASPAQASSFSYGGQAVIEGVMIRGELFSTVAIRRPNGELTAKVTRLSTLYTGALRHIPMLRGVIVLAETLVLGMKALSYSANVSLEEEEKELGRWSLGLMMAVSLTIAISLFFMLPLFLVQFFDSAFDSSILSNVIEGVVRLGLFLGYVWGIGFMPDIRRVFAYHGAEHMTVKAHEAGEPLEVSRIRPYSTAHPRCGTAFLLVVMVVAIVVFVFFGKPPMLWRIISRVVLIPVIAGLAYEVIRFSGKHQGNPLVRAIMAPSLLLQVLTTRRPDDSQIEVAVHAMRCAIAADGGQELPSAEQTVAPGEECSMRDSPEYVEGGDLLPPPLP